MDKPKLIQHLKAWFAFAEDADPHWCYLTEIKILNEIIDLISAHGAEAEVGDGERREAAILFEGLLAFANIKGNVWMEGDEKGVDVIRALIRQRRTVSRGKVHQIAERLMTTALRHSTTDLATDLTGEFAELGIEVEEPKGGGEKKP